MEALLPGPGIAWVWVWVYMCMYIYIYLLHIHVHFVHVHVSRWKWKSQYKRTEKLREYMDMEHKKTPDKHGNFEEEENGQNEYVCVVLKRTVVIAQRQDYPCWATSVQLSCMYMYCDTASGLNGCRAKSRYVASSCAAPVHGFREQRLILKISDALPLYVPT